MKRWESSRLSFHPGAETGAMRPDIYLSGAIYFLLGTITGHIKIGWSRFPRQRALDIAAECSEPIVYLGMIGPRSREQEAQLHDRFAHHQVVGEWFQPGDDLAAFLKACAGVDLALLPPLSGPARKPAAERKSDAKV